MNIEAKPGSELATRSSYENFVIELAEGMKVDENVFLPKKEGEFDYEDIFSWIRAVDFRNGKPPKIERTIKEDRGIKTLELKTQELDEITDENKKLSSESQLYAMAVTEAKMAVVAELAEDTYPAVRYQINEIRREMQKVRQEIFGVEDREKSVKEILDRMVRSKKIQTATALIIAAMILAACTNPTQVSATETVNPTRPVATEVSPTPATPTAEQAVLEPTPTVETIPFEERKILLEDTIEYGGYKFGFEISMMVDDKTTQETLDKYGIESFVLNENKQNVRELLAKAFLSTFLETYNFQNGANVSLEEFLANPGNYPAMIMMRGEDGKLTKQAITVDQIKDFEMKYVKGWSDELYMTMPGQTSTASGYAFDEGRFVFYSGLSGNLGNADSLINDGLKNDPVFPYFVAFDSAGISIRNALGLMPYTVFRIEEYKDYADLEGKKIFSTFDQTTDTLFVLGMTKEQVFEWIISHELFLGTLK